MVSVCWNTHTPHDRGNKITPSCSPPPCTVTCGQPQCILYSATQHFDKLPCFRLTRSFIRETMNRRYVLISCLLVFFFLILCQRKTGSYYHFKLDFKIHPLKIFSVSQNYLKRQLWITLSHNFLGKIFSGKLITLTHHNSYICCFELCLGWGLRLQKNYRFYFHLYL